MSLISETILQDAPAVLEKTSGEDKYVLPIIDAIYQEFGGDEDENLTGIYTRGGGVGFYPTDPELISMNSEAGTIEFNSYDSTYRIRKFNEGDAKLFVDFDLPLTTQMMEEIMAKDAEVGVDQTVEALVNEDTRVVEAIAYTIPDIGLFFRENGKWEVATTEKAQSYDGYESIDIEYNKAKELVEKWDAGEISADEDLQSYAAAEEAEAE